MTRTATRTVTRTPSRALLSLSVAAVSVACLALGAFVPMAACNGTGTTPMCDFPDGASNPVCGVLIEASAEGAAFEDVTTVEDTGPAPKPDGAADATAPVDADASSGTDADKDASDAHIGIADAPSDGPAADAHNG